MISDLIGEIQAIIHARGPNLEGSGMTFLVVMSFRL